jgi:putative membrane protein
MSKLRSSNRQGRMRAVIALSLVSAFLLAAACNDKPEDPSRPLLPGDAGGPAERVYRSNQEDSGVESDSQLLQVLLTVNDGEVKRARLAEERAVDPKTRELATIIGADHAAANDRIRAIGQTKRLSREPSAKNTELESEAGDVMARLESRSGLAFDRVWLEAEITAHVKAMALFDHDIAFMLTDSDLAQAVDEARKDTAHRERAQELWRGLPRDASAPTSESVSTSWIDSGAEDAPAPPRDAGFGSL